jgi:hypothetical protein
MFTTLQQATPTRVSRPEPLSNLSQTTGPAHCAVQVKMYLKRNKKLSALDYRGLFYFKESGCPMMQSFVSPFYSFIRKIGISL